jgi:hypothetical protein
MPVEDLTSNASPKRILNFANMALVAGCDNSSKAPARVTLRSLIKTAKQ